jgi:hypothetical protein
MKNTSLSAVNSSQLQTNNNIKVLRIPIGKEQIRHFEFFNGDERISVYHLYPTLADWVGKEAPEDINPRSHDKECLKGHVPAQIENTINNAPSEFYLANRGLTLLAESVKFFPEKKYVEIYLTDTEMMHGLADGATTDAVIHKVQNSIADGKNFRDLKSEEIPVFLKLARVHVEIIVGINDRERIGQLTGARNTSRQVKAWSLSDFDGVYDWIQKILERDHGPFAGRIGYEENAGKEVTILDVLSLMTLFHKEYDSKVGKERSKAPTVAYSSKGRMDARLKDKKLSGGYKALEYILEDILKLHDFVQREFESAYKKGRPKHRLGGRRGFQSKKEVTLPLTGVKTNYLIPSGIIFPLLASLRSLVEYDTKGKANWVCDPFQFFKRNGAELVEVLMEMIDGMLGGNPQTAGKKKSVYTAVHSAAKNLLNEEHSIS